MAAKQTVFDSISAQYFQLTNAEKRVADYILQYRGTVQYMSISELAEACGVADATISRFCRRLGQGGFNAFKLALAKDSLPSGAAPELRIGNSYTKLYETIMEEAASAMEQTAALLMPEQVFRAVELLCGASRVFCMGQGGSMVMAQEAWTMFSSVSSKFLFVPDPQLQINTAALMGEQDVVLFFSYSGATRDFQDLAQMIRRRKAKVILVSRFLNSPGGQVADVVLQCGANETPLQQGSAAARISQLFVLDVLFRQLCQADPTGTELAKARIGEAAAQKHL